MILVTVITPNILYYKGVQENFDDFDDNDYPDDFGDNDYPEYTIL